MKTVAEYEAELEAVRAELRSARLELSRGRVNGTTVATATSTVVGLEEMTLLVDERGEVHYVNAPMARLLGIEDRRAALGTPLTRWDAPELGDGVLTALVELARTAGAPVVLERSCPGLDSGRLPRGAGQRPVGEAVLRYTGTRTGNRVQVVAQDVTRLRWLESTFSRFVSHAVIEQLLALPDSGLLTAERREVTVLFGDLRGFTSITGSHEPEAVRDLVNGYLGEMVECLRELEGTLEGFAGDGFMAIFGAPVPGADHALRALVCAATMIERHGAFMRSREAQGKVTRPMGIGLATGPALVGNIGTPERLHYTALGHTTNLAARLCAEAGPGQILTVPATHAGALAGLQGWKGALPRFAFDPLGPVELKNAGAVEVLAVRVG